jgi:GNAT superfamily N-acetyltransferase
MVVRVEDAAEKRRIAGCILNALPEWFGLPDSTREYIEKSAALPFWADLECGAPAGFIVLKQTGPAVGEIYVMGVRKALHRRGIGRQLYRALYAECRARGYRFLQVKTVAAGCYAAYDRTRLFYESLGFTQLEVLPTLWDAWNPCLVMVTDVR